VTPGNLAAIHSACFTSPRPWSTAEFTDLLSSPNVVLVSEGQGFALARFAEDEAELLTIAVAPSARRVGTARILMDRLFSQLKSRGTKSIILEVRQDNTAAIALYLKFGFVEIGRRRKYYGRSTANPCDAVVMSVQLPITV
jgi:ribosomal-protein-alanine N-acetyltransferase